MKLKSKFMLLLLLPLLFSNSPAVIDYEEIIEDYDRVEILNIELNENKFSGEAKIVNNGDYFISPDAALIDLYNKENELINSFYFYSYIAPYQTKSVDIYFVDEWTNAIEDIASIKTDAFKFEEDDMNDYCSIEDIILEIQEVEQEDTILEVTIPTTTSKKSSYIKYLTLDLLINDEKYVIASDSVSKSYENISSTFELDLVLTDLTNVTISDFSVYKGTDYSTYHYYPSAGLVAIYALALLPLFLIPVVIFLIILLVILIVKAKKKKGKKVKANNKLDTSFDETSLEDDNKLDSVEFNKDDNNDKYNRE